MRILVALGGSALLRRGEPGSAPSPGRAAEEAAAALAELAAEHELIVAHAGGREAGQALELALRNRLPERDVISVLTEVVVAADDPALRQPSEPVGPVAIAEIRCLRVLVDSGALVICSGGDGKPVAPDGAGTMHEVDAAIDQDLTAALLARRLDADALLLLTDVDAAYRDSGEPGQRPIAEAGPAELREVRFAPGAIEPKVEAACRFAAATGRRAAIGSLRDAARLVRERPGRR